MLEPLKTAVKVCLVRTKLFLDIADLDEGFVYVNDAQNARAPRGSCRDGTGTVRNGESFESSFPPNISLPSPFADSCSHIPLTTSRRGTPVPLYSSCHCLSIRLPSRAPVFAILSPVSHPTLCPHFPYAVFLTLKTPSLLKKWHKFTFHPPPTYIIPALPSRIHPTGHKREHFPACALLAGNKTKMRGLNFHLPIPRAARNIFYGMRPNALPQPAVSGGNPSTASDWLWWRCVLFVGRSSKRRAFVISTQQTTLFHLFFLACLAVYFTICDCFPSNVLQKLLRPPGNGV